MHRKWLMIPAVLGPLFNAGCSSSGGPELARVTGSIKLDGTPLPEASVTFVPESGRPSFGVTDSDGRFDLMYTNDKRGAMPGEHTIRVSTHHPGDQESGTRAQPERIPASYNTASTLKKRVEPGSNDIEILIASSDGKVVQRRKDR